MDSSPSFKQGANNKKDAQHRQPNTSEDHPKTEIQNNKTSNQQVQKKSSYNIQASKQKTSHRIVYDHLLLPSRSSKVYLDLSHPIPSSKHTANHNSFQRCRKRRRRHRQRQQDMMIPFESTFRNIEPYPRLYIFIGVWILCAMHNIICYYYYSNYNYDNDNTTTTNYEITPGCFVPDMAVNGYTNQQAMDWYKNIGRQGRFVYAYILFPLDVIIMVGYTSCLTSQILVSFPKTERQLWFLLAYVPIVTVTVDLIESMTHATMSLWLLYNEYDSNDSMDISLSSSSSSSSVLPIILSIASMATRLKFVFLNFSLLLGFVGMIIRQEWWRPTTTKTTKTTTKTLSGSLSTESSSATTSTATTKLKTKTS